MTQAQSHIDTRAGLADDLDLAKQRAWRAQLSLRVEQRHQRACIADLHHCGPLRVQRPFYPEGVDCCHVYLLHPPGGLVNGDELSLNLEVAEHAHGLFTTPSAGKAYRSLSPELKQRQSVQLTVASQAVMEWMPQENIIFDGAQAELDWRVTLDDEAKLFAWEMTCLGRPAANEVFRNGHLQQRLQIWRNTEPLYIERLAIAGNSRTLDAPWGLHGQPAFGTAFATINLSESLLSELRVQLQEALDGDDAVAVTQRKGLIIARYVGASAAAGRGLFIRFWELLRPQMIQRPACQPRIWNT